MPARRNIAELCASCGKRIGLVDFLFAEDKVTSPASLSLWDDSRDGGGKTESGTRVARLGMKEYSV